MRQIVLDTETTGLEIKQGNRIIEIGAVEIVNRKLTGNHYHQYIQPDRESEEGALAVHGITSKFLADKPRFADIAQEFVDYIRGAELIIHNAPFDVGFLNNELQMLGSQWEKVDSICSILDSLVMARKIRPGQKNNLDALCRFYGINNAHRELHGALLDSEILADVYLAMTGGQVSLLLGGEQTNNNNEQAATIKRLDANREKLVVQYASEEEIKAHQDRLEAINKASGGACVWLN